MCNNADEYCLLSCKHLYKVKANAAMNVKDLLILLFILIVTSQAVEEKKGNGQMKRLSMDTNTIKGRFVSKNMKLKKKSIKEQRKRIQNKNNGNNKKRRRVKNNTRINKLLNQSRGCMRHDDPHRECTHKTILAIKNYKRAINWLKQTRRIEIWVSQTSKKYAKAATAFEDGLDAMITATNNGTACAGAVLDSNTTAVLDTLRSCSVTAAAACDTSTLDISGLAQCETDLEAWIDTFEVGTQHLIYDS